MMLFLTAILLVTLITIYWQSEKNMMARSRARRPNSLRPCRSVSRR